MKANSASFRASGAHVALDHFGQARLVDGHDALLEVGDLFLADVQRGHPIAEIGKRGGRDQPDIPHTNDANILHGCCFLVPTQTILLTNPARAGYGDATRPIMPASSQRQTPEAVMHFRTRFHEKAHGYNPTLNPSPQAEGLETLSPFSVYGERGRGIGVKIHNTL
jgi:hypothetical protein